MLATLVFPPFADPTCPYLSLPYLSAFIRARSEHQVVLIDANIEALVYLSENNQVSGLITRATEMLARLDKNRSSWADREHRLYRDLALGRDLTPESLAEALQVIRDPEKFYDYRTYYPAALVLMRWLKLLTVDGCSGQFYGLAASSKMWCSDGETVSLRQISRITRPEVLEQVAGPFRSYYREALLPRFARSTGPQAVGFSVTYESQLAQALFLAREIRRLNPMAYLIMGGTEPTQLWKYTRGQNSFPALLKYVDAIVVGEGESALLDLLDACESGSGILGVESVVTKQTLERRKPVKLRIENLDALPTPHYGELPWDSYFAPNRLLLYAPSRGCYWGKCAFCDYGLAVDGSTTLYRERNLEAVMQDLVKISRISPHLYLSVDSLSPRFLQNLAGRIIDQGLDVRWSAEVRPEKKLGEAAPLLAGSGCVALSIGLESGSQRVLDLMKKGTRVNHVRQVILDLAAAGICVQVMCFTDFPSETAAEAHETLDLLEELRSSWTFGRLGFFGLLPGSAVANEPGLYGIEILNEHGNLRSLDWRVLVSSKTRKERPRIERRRLRLNHPAELDRPLVGGIDSTHSLLYMARFGRAVTAELDSVLPFYKEELAAERGFNLIFKPRAGLRITFTADGQISADLGANRGIFALSHTQLETLLATGGGRTFAEARAWLAARVPGISDDDFARAWQAVLSVGAVELPHERLLD